MEKSCSSFLKYPRDIHFSFRNTTNSELWLYKFVEIHVFKFGEVSELFLFSTEARFLILKPAALEDVHLHPVASEASGVRILNTNQLHNIKQLLKTNQKLILMNIT